MSGSGSGAKEDFEAKMRQAGLSEAFISSFLRCYADLISGRTGEIPESSITPVDALPSWDTLPDVGGAGEPALLLAKTVVLKLNGGLGTSMGLEKAKSLLKAKGELTFLDVMLRQVQALRAQAHAPALRFVFLNSFSTSNDTVAYVREKFPEEFAGAAREDFEILQNKAPKVDATTLRPVSWPANRELEWCPPGHGDLFAALDGSGRLEQWVRQGYAYLFVSNSDNLGATLEPKVLAHFAASGAPMLMQVCPRGPTHRKGGHLAYAKAGGGGLLLREVAQCPKADEASFQDITRHRYFNTNSLWVNLPRLLETLRASPDRCIPLPLITNVKTVDPRDKTSPKVYQLETAMGAAIASLPGSQALVVPATHYFPVKACGDLLALRSDAYELAPPDFRLRLAPECEGHPPVVTLDEAWYKVVDSLSELVPTPECMPSLRRCRSLRVVGPVAFAAPGATVVGDVEIVNEATGTRKQVPGNQVLQGRVVL